jgi:hypothetical protein
LHPNHRPFTLKQQWSAIFVRSMAYLCISTK